MLASWDDIVPKSTVDGWNEVLARESSGYRFVGVSLTAITSEQEINGVADAITSLHPYPNAREHLENAARLLGERTNPDYGNSIKEALSALELLCQAITNNPKAEFGDA